MSLGRRDGAAALMRSFFVGLPAEAWCAAGLAALLHMLPVWLAAWSTPDGWTFTGITTVSPDYMQYRIWMNQTLEEGIVVSDLLTSESNRPFLPVVLYWGVGHISRLIGAQAVFVYQYLGCLFAALLALTLFGAVRHFLADVQGTGRRMVFWIILLGGGLGGYLKLLVDVPFLYDIDTVRRLFVDPVAIVPIFEDYRQHYVITTLFDTHFLLIWLLALLSVLVLYVGLERGRLSWALWVAPLWATTALVHVYTGVTLSVVAMCVLALYRLRGWWEPRMLLQAGAAVGAVGLMAVWMLVLQRGSGIPMPAWREPVIAASTVVLAYPLQLAVLTWGLTRVWRDGARDKVFLMGWALGCLLLTLSTPFYPYPSRGTVTLIVPLTALAGLAYFRPVSSVSRWAVLVALLLTASTPVWRMRMILIQGEFRESVPHQFMSSEHLRVAEALAAEAEPGDLLLTSPRDALWLAPYHPGRNFAAHFFLTVDYDAKVQAAEDFLRMSPDDAGLFLDDAQIDLFWVDAGESPSRLLEVDGVVPLVETAVGTLFRYGG